MSPVRTRLPAPSALPRASARAAASLSPFWGSPHRRVHIPRERHAHRREAPPSFVPTRALPRPELRGKRWVGWTRGISLSPALETRDPLRSSVRLHGSRRRDTTQWAARSARDGPQFGSHTPYCTPNGLHLRRLRRVRRPFFAPAPAGLAHADSGASEGARGLGDGSRCGPVITLDRVDFRAMTSRHPGVCAVDSGHPHERRKLSFRPSPIDEGGLASLVVVASRMLSRSSHRPIDLGRMAVHATGADQTRRCPRV